MRRSMVTALVVCGLGIAQVAYAQDRWTVELRGGATQATETFTTTDLEG